MDLFAEWTRVALAVGAKGDIAGAGARLLGAYGSPERAYHDLRHLTEVLERVDELAAAASDPDLVRLAAWFHDAVYDTGADHRAGTEAAADAGESDAGESAAGNEELSAQLAERELLALRVDPEAAEEVARLVRLTAEHDPDPFDANGCVLCDADLAVLARDPAGYADYVTAVRREYAHVPDELFRRGRAAILRGLLAQPVLFRTPLAHDRWAPTARANVTAELRDLEP